MLKYQSAATHNKLPLTFTEYFNLPLYLRDTILENQKKLTETS